MSTLTTLDQYRPLGAKNFTYLGDVVAVNPPHGRRFLATVRRLAAPDPAAPPDQVEVHVSVLATIAGQIHTKHGTARVVTYDRVERITSDHADKVRENVRKALA